MAVSTVCFTHRSNIFSTYSTVAFSKPCSSTVFSIPASFYAFTDCRGRLQLKCDGTRWRTGGEVKGKLANGVVASTLHTTSEHGVSSITTADAHTSAASSRLNWRPRRFKWARPFRRKTKSGFCACAITFQTQSTTDTNPASYGEAPHSNLCSTTICVGLGL
jgi:hypothetical protein